MDTHDLPKITSEENQDKFNQRMQTIKDEAVEKHVAEKAQLLELPYINLSNFPISAEAISILDEDDAKKTGVLCFFYNGEEFRLGIYDENHIESAANLGIDLEKRFHSKGMIYFISEKSFLNALKIYKSIPKIRKISKGVKIAEAELENFKREVDTFHDLQNKIEDVSLTDLITLVIAVALKSRSSDIHIEAEEKDIKVRFRIDGVLHDAVIIRKDSWSKIISRIKLLASLKLNITNTPQDGRFTIFLESGNIDVRVSTLPTVYGESVAMRLLTSGVQGLTFEKLGLRKRAFAALSREVLKPNGMIITTGPTGSGKTTTLYSILQKLNSPDKKIITLEDPVEYKLAGINQSQIDHLKGYTFAKGLRSILRQDPDVVMVGEIRDDETTDIAINAALTGHLVISTIHTNSASGAIPRFLALNAKPYLLAPSLNCVIGQRLLRRICENCREEYNPSQEEITEVKNVIANISKKSEENFSQNSKEENFNNIKFYRGGGCGKCQKLGYKGRVGIYEVMVVTEGLRKNILAAENISEYDIEKLAQQEGMLTMRQDGLLKAMEGITTLEEVFRVTK